MEKKEETERRIALRSINSFRNRTATNRRSSRLCRLLLTWFLFAASPSFSISLSIFFSSKPLRIFLKCLPICLHNQSPALYIFQNMTLLMGSTIKSYRNIFTSSLVQNAYVFHCLENMGTQLILTTVAFPGR